MNPTTTRISLASGLVAAVAAAFLAGGLRGPAIGQAVPLQTPQVGASTVQSNTVSVSGTGRVAGKPDTLQLQLGVESHGSDVSKALAAASVVQRKLIASLRSQGVAEVDLQTNGLNVRANYRYKEGAPPTLIDYIATQSLTAKLRDLTKAGAIITAAVATGGNDVRLDGINFALERNSDLIVKARDAAFADAKAKAQQYAKLAGRELGTVSTVTEQTYESPRPEASYAAGSAPAMDAKSVPIEAGSQEVAVNVQIVWTLK